MVGSGRIFWGAAGVALFMGALTGGCSDSNELSLGGGGAGAAGVAAGAGAAEAGSGDLGSGGDNGGTAGEAPAMGGAAGAPPPVDVAGAAGEGNEPDCGSHNAGPHCEFNKILPLDTTDLDGWSLGEIVALSDDGRVIAGNRKLNGKYTGWVIHL